MNFKNPNRTFYEQKVSHRPTFKQNRFQVMRHHKRHVKSLPWIKAEEIDIITPKMVSMNISSNNGHVM
jgi:hypothetical protein